MVRPSVLLKALSFAARRHSGQARKGADASPYVNHVIDVALILATDGQVDEEPVLVAAILHDTVEDTNATFQELEATFGREVADLVGELTDDKTLPKEKRKALQIDHAPSSSIRAKQLKLADKIANLEELAHSPPHDWDAQRRGEYVNWAEAVVSGCRPVNAGLEARFDEAVRRARRALSI